MEQGSMGVRKKSAIELIESYGPKEFVNLLRERFTEEEYMYMGVGGRHYSANLASKLFMSLDDIVYDRVSQKMLDTTIEKDSEYEFKNAQIDLQTTPSKQQEAALRTYTNILLRKIAHMLSRLDLDKMVNIFRAVIKYNKERTEVSGKSFNDLDKEDRVYRDIQFLLNLEKTLSRYF